MNTTFNQQELDKIWDTWMNHKPSTINNLMKRIATKQDSHTKSILADEVRKMIKNKTLNLKGYNSQLSKQNQAYNVALQAVLKVIEAKE